MKERSDEYSTFADGFCRTGLSIRNSRLSGGWTKSFADRARWAILVRTLSTWHASLSAN
jgi:hypothetical protein